MFIDGTDSLSSLSQQITACGNHTYATKVMAIERVLYRDIDMEEYILHSQNKGTKLYFSLSLASISFFFLRSLCIFVCTWKFEYSIPLKIIYVT